MAVVMIAISFLFSVPISLVLVASVSVSRLQVAGCICFYSFQMQLWKRGLVQKKDSRPSQVGLAGM